LQKENVALAAEVHSLRDNIIGAEFPAWDFESLLKQFENHRERWAEFLFNDDAKNGQKLAIVIKGVFGTTQKFVTQYVDDSCRRMYDVKLSSTNRKFIRDTLQSNYAAFESDIKNHVNGLAKSNLDCIKLKNIYTQSYKTEEAANRFHNLFNEIIRISGMLVLCEPKLIMSQEYNRNDPKTFVQRITTAEKEVVCFPGLDITDPGGNIRKSKVWIATPSSAGK